MKRLHSTQRLMRLLADLFLIASLIWCLYLSVREVFSSTGGTTERTAADIIGLVLICGALLGKKWFCVLLLALSLITLVSASTYGPLQQVRGWIVVAVISFMQVIGSILKLLWLSKRPVARTPEGAW